MQKICVIILLSALSSNHEALPQTKWSRPIHNTQGQLTRERRQFPFGEWIPLSQPCPTCRPFADPLDAGLRGENIGLTPPRPPTVTRQIDGEGNFFSQDESSILSVPPPPPSAIPRHPITSNNGNFQFSSFGQQFTGPLTVPTQKIFPQAQQIPFLPQTFLSNQPLLVNGNQQLLSNLNTQNNLFGQDQNQQLVSDGKATTFNSDIKTQKLPENVLLEQNKRPAAQKQAFSNKPQPFRPAQQNQQQNFIQQQSFGSPKQHSVNFGNSILTPPPAPNNVTQNVVIPGLDKEEIQLLYVPVETLRQRGTAQEQQLVVQQPQNIQFYNRANGLQRPVNNIRPTEQTLVTQPKGHFASQNRNNQGQTDISFKVTSVQPFPTSVTPSTLLLQHLPFQQTPQSFVSATPATPTIQPFVTPASAFQKFSPFTPETTLPHLSTIPSTVQFSQSDTDFGTTPKTVVNQDTFKEEKSQFSGFKSTGFDQEREGLQQPLRQPFVSQYQAVTQQPHLSTDFPQDQQKELLPPNNLPHQIDQQIVLQKQQEHQRLLHQQRQKELEEKKFIEQQRKQKELEEQRLLQQHQKELEEKRFLEQQRKQKELEEQRLLQQRQKELEQQQFLQKQKELEEQHRLQQQRQKELEQQQILQKQRELEEQRLLQQQRQRELEEQRLLQEQRQRELENQRRLQLQKQKELEEKRRLHLKQKEEEQKLFQQQKEQQRLLQQQQEEQQRLLQQQKLQKQKQENLKKQQQFQFFQQQQQQQQLQHQEQQKQNFPQQVNRHVLPANDKLNFIPQLEKESEREDQQLVPHQPPLSVFFKGYNGAEARITDVLRELRGSNTITVLDQYFEKMPKVFVGPAGLIPPPGYGKFELPYLSNLESNRIERRIDKLPFFVAPLNFIPPPGYAKIPFPSPHIGSVVVSSESNPAMTLKSAEKGPAEEEGSFPMVGPELPGLINNLDTETTTVKSTTRVSTPSLPQTTAQLRNRRPNTSLYKPQSRKPITRTRPATTSKPEEEVTQPIQKTEVTKEPEGGLRKPFNRLLSRRRQQAKTTTQSPLKAQQNGKSLENRYYSVEVYHQEKNQLPRTQKNNGGIQEKQSEEDHFTREFEHQTGSIDRITPSGHGVFEILPTPGLAKTSPTEGSIESEERRPEISDYADINLQTFEDGPLPTGSAKTITQELYRPNTINQPDGDTSYKISKPDSTPSSVEYQPATYEDVSTKKVSEISDISPTVGLVGYKDNESELKVSPPSTPGFGSQNQEGFPEKYYTTELPRTRVSFTPVPVTDSGKQYTKGFLESNEQYTSAFAEISKPHHIPGFVDSSKKQHSKLPDIYPTAEISVDLQTPFSHSQNSQEFEVSGEVRPTQNSAEFANNKFAPTGSSDEQYLTGFDGFAKSQESSEIAASQVSPTAPGTTEGRTAEFLANSRAQNSAEINDRSKDERIGSFLSLHDVRSTAESPGQQYFSSSTAFPSEAVAADGDQNRNHESPIIVQQNEPQVSSTSETVIEVTTNPSVPSFTPASALDDSGHVKEQTQTVDGHNQVVTDNSPNDHGLRLPNPSIVRVRTRVRGKSRGQVNFAASQSTTPVSFTRSGTENRYSETPEVEYTTKTHFRDHYPVKTSKFNSYRNVKKPARVTTEATTTEYDKKANVYTIRPQRRPLNPSTVSTKRIRKPTTPIPSAESATEAFGISTVGSYSQSADISPSGVSNDVFYEQSSLSPVKHKLKKHFGSAEQKNDVVPLYLSTAYPSTAPTFSSFAFGEYDEESDTGKNLTETAALLENSGKYPDWNPSESGFDVSGIVLTTIRTPEHEDQPDFEEPKKSQDSKKAFDPDLEKKTGRRRVRVRVHKRPHENFETAESQNLRTVANVLVPPTTTYKPNDESNFHTLVKNADFSFGGQKFLGLRSREYFRKRLNLTQSEGVLQNKEGEKPTEEKIQETVNESTERTTESGGLSGFVRKVEKLQKNDFQSVSAQSNESRDGSKILRPKLRGFVRKIVKPAGAIKETDSELNQVPENEDVEGKHEISELHSRQPFRLNQSVVSHTGKVNSTRHKTFIRYIKKNKLRTHDAESHQASDSQESQKENPVLQQTTESHTSTPEPLQVPNTELQTEVQDVKEEKKYETEISELHSLHKTENLESQQSEATEEPEIKQSRHPFTQSSSKVELEVRKSSSQDSQFTTSKPSTPLTQLYLTQRPKFYQTLRPVFQRTTQTGFQQTREPGFYSSTTEQSVSEPQEKRNGFTRVKYGKTSGFGTSSSEKFEETKKLTDQQLKNKNLHTLEVRKYLRTKSREGVFSQFSKNKYFTSEKTDVADATKDQESAENESEEITTETAVESSSSEFKTTQGFVTRNDVIEKDGEITEKDEEPELQVSTTESITSSEEEGSEEDVASSVTFETTTETETPTTIFNASAHETPEKSTEPKSSIQTTEGIEAQRTEYQPDIYRFSKSSFSFDEAEKFTGTKNRAHVRNITTDIIENTASFSAPGVEKRPDILVVTHRSDEEFSAATESRSDITLKEKTEGTTTEMNSPETTTEYLETTETETTSSTEAVTKAKVAKVLKTSTTTKISHETEICYRGKCIRTKSENPDEDLKLLVDSASTTKIEKTKT